MAVVAVAAGLLAAELLAAETAMAMATALQPRPAAATEPAMVWRAVLGRRMASRPGLAAVPH